MSDQAGKKKLLSMQEIHKGFNGVPVLKGIDFDVYEGEVVTIIGSNGAGKSTLMNIISGVYLVDSGKIIYEGKEVDITDPNVAEKLKIGTVYQEPSLCENMKVYENIFLNRELRTGSRTLDKKRMRDESRNIMKTLGFTIDVDKQVQDLPLVSKVIVSIAKAMLLHPKLLILDEVTAALNQKEVEHLFTIIDGLRQQGLGIIFISHKIREIVQLSDRVVVLRDGNIVGIFDKTKDVLNEKDIINLMLGETNWEGEYADREMTQHSDTVLLQLQGLSKKDMFEDITMDVYEREIIGLAGLKGSGITELLYSVFGIIQYDSGDLTMRGKPLKAACPSDAIAQGVCMITNDRQNEGLALTLPNQDNILVAALERVKSGRFLNRKKAQDTAKDYIARLGVKTTGPAQQVQFLSGGNQQKVVVAKWLLKDSDVILIDEPTRGIDIKAKNEIYNLLLEEKEKNKAIVMYSPETRELLNVCDRIFVIHRGRIIAEVDRKDERFTEKGILEIMHSY